VSEAYFFIFDGSPEGRVLLSLGDGDDKRPIPVNSLERYDALLESRGGVSRTDGGDMWGAIGPSATLPEGFVFVRRRELPALCGYDFFNRSGAAFQVMSLHMNNKFCGRCGAPMRDHEIDSAMECPECGRMIFPSLCPAAIVAVEKEGLLLMGHNVNFPEGQYSVLAGFVEPGETIEQAVVREIYEESKIRVKNIRYFASQPWPFPASMMFAFKADWESGEPEPDGKELTDVRWFAADSLPSVLPPAFSISRRLINEWLERNG
jgi:NAD+ diphosphatase